jgi:outer membrane protein assembly factor BamB
MRDASTTRPRFASLVASVASVALVAGGGCSFLLDFPDERATGGTGAGGAGGADGAICEAFAAPLTVDRTAFTAVMRQPMDGAELRTTGLAFNPLGPELFAYGYTMAGLEGLFTGSQTNVRELFLTRIPDQGTTSLAMGAVACNYTTDARSGRIALLSDGRPLVTGTLGFDTLIQGPGTWSLATSDVDQCMTAPLTVQVQPGLEWGGAPFFGLVDTTSVNANVAMGADGVGLDADQRGKQVAVIGIASGQVYDDATLDGREYFFLQHSDEMGADVTFVLDEHFSEYHQPPFGEAGIAVDDEGSAWFGGGSCDVSLDCSDSGAFFGKLPAAGTPELIVERPGTPSAIAAIRFADDTLVLGGHYAGTLSMLGAELPGTTSVDAFVLAVDPKTREVRWTYPGTTASPGYERTGFDTVVDLGVLGEQQCGAVYVLGCIVPGGGADAECVTPAPSKRAFLAKLDLATGREIWVEDIVAENPSFDFFLPTALTASTGRVWLAATVNGQFDVAGLLVDGAAPQETVVLELSP